MHSQRGNALFLILIAVALFAALSYAVTQSGRGGGTVDRETLMIAGSRITQYPATLATAITRMILSGTSVSNISFQTDMTAAPCAANPTYCVFSSSGGAAISQTPPSGIGTVRGGADGTVVGVWGYKDLTDATLGFYIGNVGTNTNVTGRDSFAFLSTMTATVCEQINKGLGLGTVTLMAFNEVYLDTGAGVGGATYDTDSTVVGNATGAAFGCFLDGSNDNLIYHHALIER